MVALRDPVKNTLNTIGRPVPETEIKVGPDGTFLVRGPQVMRGYYKEPELTAAVLNEDGWFDTGDLGKITPEGDLVFIGRLGALIVADPDSGAVEAAIAAELRKRTGPAGGFRSFEHVLRFKLLDEPFSPENGFLTATLKMRRNVIAEKLADNINSLYQ